MVVRCRERGRARVLEEVKSEMEPEERPEEKPLELRQCQRYLERTLVREFRAIVRGFVSEARNGSCAHMKLAAELLQTARERKVRQRKGAAQRLLEELGE